jgi:hypothetical protein
MMGTERQNEANRVNAAKSTGPTSVDGKTRSARNAMKHGMYAELPSAVPRGLFDEDPEEVAAFVDRIVTDLDPRDNLEAAQAQRIGIYFLRLRRLDRFEAEALAGVTNSRLFNNDRSKASPGAWESQAEESAGMAIERTMERASRIDARIARGLERALIVYYQLRVLRSDDVVADASNGPLSQVRALGGGVG